MGIIQYFDFEDAEVFIFDEFIINQVKEGVVIEPSHNDILNDIVQEFFSGKNMVYISNRAKSYSVNPLIYPETEKIPNIIAIAVIPDTPAMRKSAKYEKEFYDKPYEIFDELKSAIVWVETILSKTKSFEENNTTANEDN
ncbi:MAG: hypothetical protein ACSHXF_11240 [Aquaticitalea sp.]